MKTFLREPLLHFLVIGLLLFAAHRVSNGNPAEDRAGHRIHVSESDVRWLTQAWSRQWQREPSQDERNALVIEYVREELLAREARDLGLDESDTVVRRRLAQKLEFLLKDTAVLEEPTELELEALFNAHRGELAPPSRLSFEQIYFRSEASGTSARAAATLAMLRAGNPDAKGLGDRMMLDTELVDVDERSVAAAFGRGFASKLFELEPGAWSGPIESAYGLHLVRVLSRQESRSPTLAEVRPQVRERWREQQHAAKEREYVRALLAKYDIVVPGASSSFLKELEHRFAIELTGASAS